MLLGTCKYLVSTLKFGKSSVIRGTTNNDVLDMKSLHRDFILATTTLLISDSALLRPHTLRLRGDRAALTDYKILML